MKAMLWEGVNRLRMIDMPEPVCNPDELKIRVVSAGVCATDAHIIHGTFWNGDPPHVLGHEIAGEVTQVGNSTLNGWLGKRVVVETAVGCGICEHCRSGNKHLCAQGGEIGFPPRQGGYAQYVCVPWCPRVRTATAYAVTKLPCRSGCWTNWVITKKRKNIWKPS